MKDIDEIRRDNLRLLERECGSPTSAAGKLEMSVAQFANLRDGAKDSKTGKPRGMRKETARRIEGKVGKPAGWLDVEHNSNISNASITAQERGVIVDLLPERRNTMGLSNTEPGPDIKGKYPLISWVQAGAWETIVDNFAPGDAEQWLGAAVNVSDSSFYLRVRGESMFDPMDHRSFRDGELALIDPNATAENGSLVVVRLDDEAEATFKQLIIEGDRKYLKALNPNWPNRIFEVNGNATICGVVKGKFVGGY